ncbi:UTRA domain-containing protein [Actinopolymorpha rutila]|uniref:GntR family transcriptional regulator n=1 Tax=Actinopolymorpha rutila TaxID=446787 RepID=A0A852Z8Y3_9ACTN|nr:GntR family transcriptional regulator [Actinopolymorpha rutila]
MDERHRVVTDGPVPKHAQLRRILESLIDGELGPDAPIPSERDLMAAHRVSRMTVREAIGQLVAEGRLYRVRGKGTFVAAPRVDSMLELTSFTEDMRRRGHEPATVVLRSVEAVPPAPVRRALGLTAAQTAYRVERLRIADGVPMALEDGWYAADRAPGLLDRDLSQSLYAVLSRSYGVVIDAAKQTLRSEVADAQTARILGVTVGAPLLALDRTSTAGGRPVEQITSWYRGDRYQVHIDLARASDAGRVPWQPAR